MGKRKAESENDGYIDRSKASRVYLTMMTKIRSSQNLGSVFCGRGMHNRAYDLYKKTVNEILGKDVSCHFTHAHVKVLEDSLLKAESVTDMGDKAWLLRSTIDTVYDTCISELNEVDSQQPSPFHTQIKNVINEAAPYATKNNFHEVLSKYTSVLKRLRVNRKFQELLSKDAQGVVEKAIEMATVSDDLESSVKGMRLSLDRLYNEVRLPDVYCPSSGPQTPSSSKDSQIISDSLLMVDFRQRDGSLFEYSIQAVDDKVMGGQSHSNVQLLEEEKYFSFNGTVSRSNRGGFASFRILPTDKDELQRILKGTKSITIEVKNTCKVNKRYKFQLANEAHLKSFNWQSEFVVEPNEDFQYICLDILSFWPTMFGHVLSSPGNVDFNKVDCLGVIISHVTVDGKENPDFEIGEFGLGIRSISLVKED